MHSKVTWPLYRSVVVFGLIPFSCLADLTLQETRNQVWTAQGLDGARQEVAAKTFVAGPQFIITGPKGGAEIAMDQDTLRLGENTILELAESGQPARLHQGSVLFDLDASSTSLRISMPDLEATLQGETGFVVAQPQSKEGKPALVVGAMAGSTQVRLKDQDIHLTPSQLAAADKTGVMRVGKFDLARQAKSSVLMHGFERPWPEAARVGKEVAKFNRLKQRGFVRATPTREVAPRLGEGSSVAGPHLVGTTAGSLLAREGMKSPSEIGLGMASSSRFISLTSKPHNSGNPPGGYSNPNNAHSIFNPGSHGIGQAHAPGQIKKSNP